MNIGDNIKKFRIQKGMTQKELADKIGRSLRMVQKYESGEVEPSIEVLNEIAKELGSSFFDFIEVENVFLSANENSVFLKKFTELTPNLVRDIINTLISNNEITNHFLIDTDLEELTNDIKNFIIHQNNILSNKNFQIVEAMNNPDKFHKEYMNNED